MTAARDATAAAERAVASAEDEVRQCLAEADEPYPYPDIGAGDKSAAQDRSSSVSQDAANKQSAVARSLSVSLSLCLSVCLSPSHRVLWPVLAKLQSQLDQRACNS